MISGDFHIVLQKSLTKNDKRIFQLSLNNDEIPNTLKSQIKCIYLMVFFDYLIFEPFWFGYDKPDFLGCSFDTCHLYIFGECLLQSITRSRHVASKNIETFKNQNGLHSIIMPEHVGVKFGCKVRGLFMSG